MSRPATELKCASQDPAVAEVVVHAYHCCLRVGTPVHHPQDWLLGWIHMDNICCFQNYRCWRAGGLRSHLRDNKSR